MSIVSRCGTDFWSSAHHRFHKDNGHFFFCEREVDFRLDLRWACDAPAAFSQCGIMVRDNNLNWAKAGILSPGVSEPQLGSIVTVNGYSDWASLPLSQYHHRISYRLIRKKSDFIIYYSPDDQIFRQLRQFHLPTASGNIKAGAYICSPRVENFHAVLEYLEIS